jgi:hypothetical protein
VFRTIRWTDWSENHIGRHDVSADDVEDVLFTSPQVVVPGERGTTIVFGTTSEGRHLMVVVVAEDEQGQTFVVTARDMDFDEKRRFRRRTR